ncbi:cytidylyltransferase domain-containing protein [Halobacillus sp. Nhm2S1]|uniref:cytidylyltransferase domain-containing protein n=1 Tax=Halobacillus sp. Nhm2S1 TaxID=2866716 RepID=UPI001C72E1A6|nr:glycosyltransferase family protein [Halobacillus sp. Nhm2S1]MBX0359454.1 glycosyltransferase family protein [Halobacillus sp. Nhm2S1]
MRIFAIIQSRMGSSRLPGKVLKKVLEKPLLEYQLERLKRCKQLTGQIVATTYEETDDPIVDLCKHLNIPFHRGDEEDVLLRYYETAVRFKVDLVVRITSDCPLIDPTVVDEVISEYLKHPFYHYVSNTLQRTYPRGMDISVFPFKVLEEVHHKAIEKQDREHVTRYIYTHSKIYKTKNVVYERDESQHRWTVDTPEDFVLIKKMLEALYPTRPNFTLEDALDLIQNHPDWMEINAHVEQKKHDGI